MSYFDPFPSKLVGLPFYLIGAFPTGMLIAKFYGIDIQKSGSGNVGATNVARVIGKNAGILTLVGDVTKGILGTLLARVLIGSGAEAAVSLLGFVVVAGHCFSIPNRPGSTLFKGGKGVATSLGVILVLAPLVALASLVIFGIVLKISKLVSLASIGAAIAASVVYLFLNKSDDAFPALVAIALLIVFRHRGNLQRIIEGQEPKLGSKL